MMQHEITRKAGGRQRRKRVGRGESSGQGKTCGRGHKGYQQRSGGGPHRLHEGGQMPIFRRLPKRGFSNVQFENAFETVNIAALNGKFEDGARVDVDALKHARLISHGERVKLLAKGALERKLVIALHACSAAAKAAVEKAGGSVELIETRAPARAARAKRNSAKDRKRERGPSRLEKKKAKRAASA